MSAQHARKRAEDFPANLTPAERLLVDVMAELGCPVEVAERLSLRKCTVENHLHSARVKAGVRTTLHLIARYAQAKDPSRGKPSLQGAWELHQQLRRGT